MDPVMLASLIDELTKIAANVVAGGVDSAIGKPASITQGSKVTTTMKPITKPTNYSVVNNQTRTADMNTAAGSKAVPPPPVRT
jgi:hypothetical protein